MKVTHEMFASFLCESLGLFQGHHWKCGFDVHLMNLHVFNGCKCKDTMNWHKLCYGCKGFIIIYSKCWGETSCHEFHFQLHHQHHVWFWRPICKKWTSYLRCCNPSLGLQPKQGFAKVQAKSELEDHISCSWECKRVWGNEPSHSQILWILGLPLGSPRTKWHLNVGPMARHKVYYKGEGGGFPQVLAMVTES